MSSLICEDETPHEKHLVEVTVDYPCSGPIECGWKWAAKHTDHRIRKQMTLMCPGYTKRAWEIYE